MIEVFFKSIVDTANSFVWGFPSSLPWLVVLLVGSGIFVTYRFGLIQIRQFGHAIQVVRGKYDKPEDEGDINHFQALSTALSATVGIGNIAGVATAMHYGGPGAMFWMWVTAVFGMALKFAECTLSMHYREFDDEGNAIGGPMYYIEKGLGKNWKWMAILFAICAVVSSFGSGNMNQANTLAVSAYSDFGVPHWISGLFVAVLVGLVIVGGIKRIGAVTAKLMPLMAVFYILGAMVIILSNVDKLPHVFMLIIKNAFTPEAGFGGSAAGVFSLTLLWGVKRGLFSNEAGQGSSPIAHAAAKTQEPVREGIVAMLEPFIDTLVICSMTAFVILITDVWDQKKPDSNMPLAPAQVSVYFDNDPFSPKNDSDLFNETVKNRYTQFEGKIDVRDGVSENLTFVVSDAFVENPVLLIDNTPYNGTLNITKKGETLNGQNQSINLTLNGAMIQNSSALTAWAFELGLSRFGNWGGTVVTIAVFLFAISTMISWSYYGDRAIVYLFGTKYVLAYKLVFIVFCFLGAILALETVWAYGDLALGFMAVPNLIAVLFLSGTVAKITKDYVRRHKKK